MSGLRREQDAFGWEMLDFHNGQPAQEIAERDDGHIGLSCGPAVYFHEYDKWAAYEKEAIALARGRVLDVGCGAGRVPLYLQAQGVDVVGIDNSPLALKVCRKRGVRKVRLMALNEIGPGLGGFETVTMFCNNFGLVGSARGMRGFLRRLRRITGPNARILASTMDPYQTNDREHLAYHRRNRKRGRMGGQIRLRVRYKTAATPWIDLLLTSKRELETIIAGTGWKVVRYCEGGGGRYIAVIERTMREEQSQEKETWTC